MTSDALGVESLPPRVVEIAFRIITFRAHSHSHRGAVAAIVFALVHARAQTTAMISQSPRGSLERAILTEVALHDREVAGGACSDALGDIAALM